MKTSGLRIRIEKELRETFLKACHQQDRPAASVLREFMQGYIESHKSAAPDIEKRPVST